MAEFADEKTEAPTPRRRQEARKDGNVAKSQDLTAAFMLLAGVIALKIFGMRVLIGLKQLIEVSLTCNQIDNPTKADDLGGLFTYTGYMFVTALMPLVLAVTAVGLVVVVSQVGFFVTPKPLQPNLSKLSPLKGVKNMFNARAGMRLVMSLCKITMLATLAVFIIIDDLPLIIQIGDLQVGQAFTASASLLFSLALKLAALLLILGIIDYSFQKWQREKDLRMTKQELKDEMKQMEGDPLTKQRRTRVARQLAMQRIAQAVPKADVIVTNPTHFAVALEYKAEQMNAPRVLAKGADFMAIRIKQIAVSHGIPIVERKPLARALYFGVDVGQEIPPEHYNAVAEILAYVYRLGTRKTA